MVVFLFLGKNDESVHFPCIVYISHNMYETRFAHGGSWIFIY